MKKILITIALCLRLSAQGVTVNGIPNQQITGLSGGSLMVSSAVGAVISLTCHATYSFGVDGGGSPGLITPASNCTLPAKAIIYGALLSWTTAGAGVTNTTSIGVTGTGGGAAVIMTATAVASLTGFGVSAVTLATPVKITTTGTVTVTTAVAALSAGICEIYLFYIVSPT